MLDIIVIVAYVIILLTISILAYSKNYKSIFSSEKIVPWWILGMSYFITNNGILNTLPQMGILLDKGYSGLWLYYTGVFSAGFVPIIFAPLWGKLKFMTDNQFTLFRFSGTGAKILHGFRAVYVGYLVVALVCSMYITAMTKLLFVYFQLNYNIAFGIVSSLMILVILKNSFNVKVKTDFLNGLLFIIAFILSAVFILNYAGGATYVYNTLNTDYYEYTRLFPEESFSNGIETIPNLLVFFMVQWWSINVLDGGGHEAQRFMSAKSSLNAFKVAIFPIIFITIVYVFITIIFDSGIVLSKSNNDLVPLIDGEYDFEAYFISLFANTLPDGIRAFAFIAFLIGFVTSYEAFLNWGSGFVSVDFISSYVKKDSNEKQKIIYSYIIMFAITLSAILISYFNKYMLGLQKFIFSMAAGVGPVFILRWFWWRINAWSQLSAMLSSLIYTIFFDLLYKYSENFHRIFNNLLTEWNFGYYPLKLLTLTILVTLAWLSITFLTKPDELNHLKKYVDRVNPSGWWPKEFARKKGIGYLKIGLLFIYAITSILPFIYVWMFKFYSIYISITLFILWILCLVIIIKYMDITYKKSD